MEPTSPPVTTNTTANNINATTTSHGDSNSSTTTTPNNTTNRYIKKSADTDLKSSIIEFMRERPFLWNCKHPSYKEPKRRESEFQAFSNQIGCPVQEIKRIWHVLRTNFFRAHKILMERPVQQHQQSNGESGTTEKLWKYYLAMEYILDGTEVDDSKDMRQTRSSRASKEFRYARSQTRELNICKNSTSTTRNTSGGNGASNRNGGYNAGSSSFNTSICNGSNNNNLNNNNNSINKCQTSLNDSTSSFDADEDHLYARSLTSTLKRFDPTTKEIIKLKFQEIIVSYMQQQSQQLQQLQQQQQRQDESSDVSDLNVASPSDKTR